MLYKLRIESSSS